MGQNFENCDDVIDGWPLKKRTEHDMSHNALNSFMLIVLELVSVEVVSWFKLFFFWWKCGQKPLHNLRFPFKFSDLKKLVKWCMHEIENFTIDFGGNATF